MISFFETNAAVFEMRVQLNTGLDEMPIEDAQAPWSEEVSQYQLAQKRLSENGKTETIPLPTTEVLNRSVDAAARRDNPKWCVQISIRVHGAAPGPIYTPLQISGGATEEHWRIFGAKYPLSRAGQPAELASIYVQLAVQDATYATGNIYGAGGGMGQP